MTRGQKLLSALLLTVLLLGARSAAWAAAYREGEALVVLRGTSGGAGTLSQASRETSASRVAGSAAGLAGASVITLHGYMTPSSDKVFALIKSDTMTTEDLMDKLRDNPDVLAASPNHILRAYENPDGYNESTQWGLAAIDAPVAWAVGGRSWGERNISVAVMDTGIDTDHFGFSEGDHSNLDIANSRNFIDNNRNNITDNHSHGTHVSGIIGAALGSTHSMVGVSPRVNLITLKVMDNEVGDSSNVLSALNHISELISVGSLNIKAINLSIGWGYQNADHVNDLLGTAEYIAFRDFEAGLGENAPVIVVAAGNDGNDIGTPFSGTLSDTGMSVTRYLTAPASFIGLKNLIVVGSVNRFDGNEYPASDFSNWSGEYVHMAAPGERILSTVLGRYDTKSGTSMAAPFVSGAVALLASKPANAELSGEELRRILFHTTRPGSQETPAPTPPGRLVPGRLSQFGLLNIGNAMTLPSVPIIPVRNFYIAVPRSARAGVAFYAAAVIEPPHATVERIIWSSSDSSIATVNDHGLVTPITSGNVTISATITANGVERSADSDPVAVSERNAPTDEEKSIGCDAGAFSVYMLLLFAFAVYCVRRFAKIA